MFEFQMPSIIQYHIHEFALLTQLYINFHFLSFCGLGFIAYVFKYLWQFLYDMAYEQKLPVSSGI